MVDAETLFAAHRSGLFKYFCRSVGRAEVARDLTQEVFVRVSRTQVPSGSDADSTAWLFRIARNLAIDHGRKQIRQPEPSALLYEPTRSASQDVDFAVRAALASLPALDRDVFLMREVAGLGYEEIAAACELTEDAVRSRLHRTRLQLRDYLAAPIATSRTLASGRTPKSYETIEP
jgi:RNA polymerase sigma-70 factor, ECF subfamily